MVDFLRENPYVTKDEYLWGWTVPQIRLASYDFTHVIYLDDEQVKMRNGKKLTEDGITSDFGMPIFG